MLFRFNILETKEDNSHRACWQVCGNKLAHKVDAVCVPAFDIAHGREGFISITHQQQLSENVSRRG